MRRSIVIDRSQNLHDWRINLSAIEVSVEFHLKGRTLLFASSLYPGNFYIIRTFLSLSLSLSILFFLLLLSIFFFFYRYSSSFRSRFRIDRITLRSSLCNCIYRETLFLPRDYFSRNLDIFVSFFF